MESTSGMVASLLCLVSRRAGLRDASMYWAFRDVVVAICGALRGVGTTCAVLAGRSGGRYASVLGLGLGAGFELGLACRRCCDCGSNSVGRVSASQAEGRGFESRLPLCVKCYLATSYAGLYLQRPAFSYFVVAQSPCRSPRFACICAGGGISPLLPSMTRS